MLIPSGTLRSICSGSISSSGGTGSNSATTSAHALERLVNLVHLIGVDLHLHELVGDLVAGDGAFVLGVLV